MGDAARQRFGFSRTGAGDAEQRLGPVLNGRALLRSAPPERRDTPFDQWRIGLHHFCPRLRSREDIDTLHAAMRDFGAKIVRAPEDGPWAPGYYSVLFEDPDGIRIEANFVPGAGNLDRIKDAPLTPVG